MGRRTVLYPCHVELGARMVDFAGWEMPVQYKGILEEHAACRERAAVFDISHMGEIEIRAEDCRASLGRVLSNDLSRAPDRAARYGFILNDEGGIIDDVITLVYDSSRAMVVTNAANTERDLRWIAGHVPAGSKVSDRSDELAKLDLQGPRSREIAGRLFGPGARGLGYFRFTETSWQGTPLVVSRTGYTGELGYELFAAVECAVDLWRALLDEGAVPAGLGARDTLRLEAGLPLYGHEFHAAQRRDLQMLPDIAECDGEGGTSPIEAGLMRYVGMEKAVDFPGRGALARACRASGRHASRLVGLEMLERGVPRAGYAVEDGGRVEMKRVGSVTSGTVSPTLGKGIAMAYVNGDCAELGRRLYIMIRGARVPCVVVEMPFYKDGTARA